MNASPTTSSTLPPAATPGQSAPRWSNWVAMTTAVLAALASIATLFSNSHASQAMIDQIETSDQWNFYQAKGVKLAIVESKLELLPVLGKEPAQPDRDRAARYKTEQEGIMAEAKAKQASAKDHRRRHDTMARAGAAFQVAIALCAVSLLVKRNAFWLVSLVIGAAGLTLLAMGFLAK